MGIRYFTTPIYYVNDRPHVGHCYSTLVVDCLARFARLAGHEVFFLTGTDEHAEKVVSAAAERGLSPIEWADRNAEEFEKAFALMGFSNDDFVRTTQARHTEKVREYIGRLLGSGDVALGEYSGWYDPSQEEYLTETEAKKHGFKSPVTGRDLEQRSEQNYFFKLSRYQDWLLGHIEANPRFIQPEARKNEVLGRIRDGLNDVPVSRAVKGGDGAWGILMPGAEGHRVYVWIDALFNYLSVVDTPERRRLWDGGGDVGSGAHAVTHVLAKDILWFHAVIWPCMLEAMGERVPDTVYAHAFWVREGRKMSKSLGNFLDLDTLRGYVEWDAIGAHGLDALRWYLLTQGPIGATDADFTHEGFVSVYNADLANGIGNAASRVANMIGKYFGGEVPETAHPDDIGDLSPDRFGYPINPITGGAPAPLRIVCDSMVRSIAARESGRPPVSAPELASGLPTQGERDLNVKSSDLGSRLHGTNEIIRTVDQFIANTRPFSIAKEDAHDERVKMVLYHSAEAIRIAAVLLSPAMPGAMADLLERFGQRRPDEKGVFRDESGAVVPLKTLCAWGGLRAGTKVVKGDALFPRIDANAEPPAAVAG